MNTNELIKLLEQALSIIKQSSIFSLLENPEWPEAAPQFLIIDNSEEDKLERAENILDYIGEDFSGKKILDFGCGEGHVALKAKELASISIGYDVNQSGNLTWEDNKDGYLLTTNFDKVTESGPFDFVILYDVLDHCTDPAETLKEVKKVCTQDTKVFVRCHPWMSRHGGHLYTKLNKAWIHLFLTNEELAQLKLELPFTQKYFFPLKTHAQWFQDAGFTIKSSEIIKGVVEPFFKKPEFIARLPEEYKGEFPEWQMSQTFNDYIIAVS